MGLKDDAERIVAEEEQHESDRRRAEDEERGKFLARAREYIPLALAKWARGMALDHVPPYTFDRDWGFAAHFKGNAAQQGITFNEDGIEFVGEVSARLDQPITATPSFKVWVRLDDRGPTEVSSVEGLAHVLRSHREYLRREREKTQYRAGIGMGNI